MPAGRITGQKHLILVEPQFVGMDCQIIQRRSAVAQFVGDVADSVVETIFDQHHVVALLEEDGRERTVVLTPAGHIETAVDIDKDGIFPDGRVRVIDIKHLSGFPVLHVGDTCAIDAGIRIRAFG